MYGGDGVLYNATIQTKGDNFSGPLTDRPWVTLAMQDVLTSLGPIYHISATQQLASIHLLHWPHAQLEQNVPKKILFFSCMHGSALSLSEMR